MNPIIKTDIIDFLKKAIECLKRGDLTELKKLSDHTIHNSSIFQDEDSISFAVVIYSLSKVVERYGEGVEEVLLVKLQEALHYIERDDLDKYRLTIKSIFDRLEKLDSKTKLYFDEVILQARIKKGSKLYDHGISMARSAEALGISEWDMMDYIGKTQIIEQYPEPTDVRSRIKFARKLFSQ